MCAIDRISWEDSVAVDYEFYGKQYFKISDNLIIQIKDTSYQFKMDPGTDEIMDTIKAEINQQYFVITSSGRIEERYEEEM